MSIDVWDLLQYLTSSLNAFCPFHFFPAVATQIVEIEGRSYRILKQIGEGGYAFVYLAQEIPQADAERPAPREPVAIKKILAATKEKLSEARHEVQVLQALSHANCLPLLAHAIKECSTPSAGRAYEVWLVTPAYQDGTLLDELDRLAVESRRLSSTQVLDIFRQVCSGVAHMHSRGYAHMDIKPLNILLKRPSRQHQQPLMAPAVPKAASRTRIRMAPSAGSDDDDDDDDDADDLEAGISLVQRGYQAVLMDFGSARGMPISIRSRAQALAMQEDAEAHCTATFRAPELFDVPSHCTLTHQVDVWALGCTLHVFFEAPAIRSMLCVGAWYSMMYGVSPFQQALDQGASLALAVMK